ncbi:MAG: hypothetical protein KJ732_03980 [Candidatus Margulisbacteria bacterium]|nr:hypothetical protein [Candidatus Margulisiibacteriota bacterium]
MKKSDDYQKILFSSLNETARKTFILTIILWSLLALNTDYNYFNIFKDNLAKYFGKSIEKKREIAYGKEYYDFLVFAKEKLPKEPVKFGLISSYYAPHLQARIYLVPHIISDHKKKDVSYLLVFKPTQEQSTERYDFSPFAKLDNNRYIMKRTK